MMSKKNYSEDTEKSQSLKSYINPLLVTVIIVAITLAWQWYETRHQITNLQQELAKRLSEIDSFGKKSRDIATEAQEASRQIQAKFNLLETKLAESQNQQVALEALYHELARNRDEVTLEEVEQLLLIANQQLQLAKNVKAALIAIEEADNRLQRIDRPRLLPLRRIITKDIDLLKTLPYVDITGISLRLDDLFTMVDILPLAMEIRPLENNSDMKQTPTTESIWLQFVREAWGDVKQLVRIQNMNRPDIPMLSPSQTYFLRENLKLRLLSARYALLAQNGAAFKADLKISLDWVNQYFDVKSKSTVSMLGTLRQLYGNEIGIELPNISASLDAVRNYRLTRDQGNR